MRAIFPAAMLPPVVMLVVLSVGINSAAAAPPNEVSLVEVYRSGEGGYHTYRIPSVVETTTGTLLAFAEGRKSSRGDAGNIDLVLRRSADGGKTWGNMSIVWDDDDNTCGNPCAVVDEITGTVWLLMTWNSGTMHESGIQPGYGTDSRRVFVTHSEDDGLSWASPTEITSDVKPIEWSWYATGPGAGIQLTRGEHAGRLVIPCDHKLPVAEGPSLYYSHVLYSDDHGQTWTHGESTPEDQVNECEVVELSDGRLLLNMRNYDDAVHARQIAFSRDGGQTWQDQQFDEGLIEPRCQASVRRLSWPSEDGPGCILFSNPAHPTKRRNMTVRASDDDGQSWPRQLVLYPGDSAYSCLTTVGEDKMGCLFETDSYSKIVFATFGLEELHGAKDE